ncbi:unnamed protein product [Cochlearia groenlandica]
MNEVYGSWSIFGIINILFNILVNGVMCIEEKHLFSDLNGANNNNNNNMLLLKKKKQEDENATKLMVELTLVQEAAAAKGAVCLDGSVPGYHFYRGSGLGANSWIIQLQDGAWCNSIENCQSRKMSGYGSSALMEKQLWFRGILSNNSAENPDFYKWNKVLVRYCDGASFSGDSENKTAQLYFRGKRIFIAVMEDLMANGMRHAKQVLLNGCSSGGLSSILRCDDFKGLFPVTTKVKCMSDAGFFLDTVDISGEHSLRRIYSGVVNTQGMQNMLPQTCTNHLDPTSCFFPQNIINQVKTPLFILNSGYDSWQIENAIAPLSADPRDSWHKCRSKFKCKATQKKVMKGFKKSMLNALNTFSKKRKNGILIMSRWAHCLAERQDTWLPLLPRDKKKQKQGVAVAVGNWYFEKAKM